MRYYLTLLCFILLNSAFAQDTTVEKELDLIDSEETAQTFVSENKNVKGKIFTFNEIKIRAGNHASSKRAKTGSFNGAVLGTPPTRNIGVNAK